MAVTIQEETEQKSDHEEYLNNLNGVWIRTNQTNAIELYGAQGVGFMKYAMASVKPELTFNVTDSHFFMRAKTQFRTVDISSIIGREQTVG